VKKVFLVLFIFTPFVLFANEGGTDIVPRTVNFIIFAAIVYYLVADKLKSFLADRSNSIQGELDKVQDALKASQKKVEDAKAELENAKKLASEIIQTVHNEVDSIKTKVLKDVENEIAHLEKSFDDKTDIELKRAKTQVVQELLDELLDGDNLELSQAELAQIVMKKVA
jgi:F-type H+-transporting ATPase subunit b